MIIDACPHVIAGDRWLGARKDPLLKTETYTYDNNDDIAQLTDRKGQLTSYTYDSLNEKTKTT